MELFVLMYDDGNDRDDLVGIFSTKEKAEEWRSRYTALDQQCLKVRVETLDEP